MDGNQQGRSSGAPQYYAQPGAVLMGTNCPNCGVQFNFIYSVACSLCRRNTNISSSATGCARRIVKVKVGVITQQINVCMIILAVIFFPIGLLFLLCMYERRCSYCGISYGS